MHRSPLKDRSGFHDFPRTVPREIGGPVRTVALTTFLVRDYDEAIGFFTDVLGFHLTADSDMGGGKRWVPVAARADGGP